MQRQREGAQWVLAVVGCRRALPALELRLLLNGAIPGVAERHKGVGRQCWGREVLPHPRRTANPAQLYDGLFVVILMKMDKIQSFTFFHLIGY